jgi:hypothetical protein
MYLAISEYRVRFANSYIAQCLEDLGLTSPVKDLTPYFYFRQTAEKRDTAYFDVEPELAAKIATKMYPLEERFEIEDALVEGCRRMSFLLEDLLKDKEVHDPSFKNTPPREE